MYLAVILLLMFVLPIGSVVVEAGRSAAAPELIFLIGKWFVFWAVGIRLLLAGIRQIAKPAFTAEAIFKITDRKALPLVQEIGFGNLAIATIAIVSIFSNEWIAPAATAGQIFYGLAGLKHAVTPDRGRMQTVAMISDLWIFVVLAVYLTATSV